MDSIVPGFIIAVAVTWNCTEQEDAGGAAGWMAPLADYQLALLTRKQTLPRPKSVSSINIIVHVLYCV